ncbi:ComEC/Rec2 family competence protein [Paracoccus sp. (in: a-proteobacteria)]|uniref:ComEC/Rec2 family competence protein n=1 Tax=Paracoccus sp. TaxID=267 RepID=UPI0026DFBCCC|nr:ComEC/Rec2 family competence protein [Paracoccus sp. (in: a-proteobacteria)]MDO5646956.1 ComEC/Rec2 family competence protein [Paracoccus sp. (in: a-proteobacteria)]
MNPGPTSAPRLSKHAAPPRLRATAAVRGGLFLWVPVCLSVGIGAWFLHPFLLAWTQWGAVLAALILCAVVAFGAPLWAERGRISWPAADWARLLALAGVMIVGGYGLAGMRAQMVAAPVIDWRYYGPVEGRVIDIDRSARDRKRLLLDQVVLRDHGPDRTPNRVRLSLMDTPDDELPQLGQRVMLTGHLGPPPGPAAPGSFDFRQHAWFMGLGAVGYSRTPIMTVAPPQGGMWWMHRARMSISAAMQDRIGGQQGAVAAALMTGDRSGIAEATNDVMRASNLYHIISISGLHMSMLAGFVYTALRLVLVLAQGLGAAPRIAVHKIAAGGALFASACYLWLSGGGVATERSFIMVAVMLAAILVDRRAISLRTIAVAAVVVLIYSPESVTTPGFQMSFAATVALILSAGPWARIAPRLHWVIRPVAMLLVSSFVAGIATSPIAAAHFNRMAQYGMLANLLAVPVMGVFVMPAGVIGALLAPLGLEGPALWVMGMGTLWMLWVAEWVASIGGAVTAIPLPPASVVPLMGFGSSLMILCWRRDLRLTRAGPLMAGFWSGAVMLILAGALWLTTTRPLILIAAEGEAVGLMTPTGRAVSKPSGGGFAISTWLLEDGDIASQSQSAARPAWDGDRRDRWAALPHGWDIGHFTGKGSGDRAAAECQPRRILVATEAIPLPDDAACRAFDPVRLRDAGALAVDMTPDGPVIRSAAEVHPRLRLTR